MHKGACRQSLGKQRTMLFAIKIRRNFNQVGGSNPIALFRNQLCCVVASSFVLKFAVKFLRIQHLWVNRFGTFTSFPGHFGVDSDGNNFDCRLAWSHMMSGDSCSYYYFSWKTWLWQKNTREGWYYRGGPTITLSLFLDLLANRSGVIFFCAC